LYTNDSDINHYVYWIGGSKIIEYNLKMESFRLYKLKNAKLEINRGSICMYENKLYIIGGLQESETIEDIII